MKVLSYRFHKALKGLAQEAFPNETIKPFYITLHKEERKSFHGDYDPSNREIRIFNLSLGKTFTLGTAIHELAHHCHYSMDGKTDHSKRFYEVFFVLLQKAIHKGWIDYEELREMGGASDIKMLERHVGKPDLTVADHDTYVIRVTNGYPIRDLLKKRGYTYMEKTWEKNFHGEAVLKEQEWLSDHIDLSFVKMKESTGFDWDIFWNLVAEDRSEHRVWLKENGYQRRKRVWIKRIPSQQLEMEKKRSLSKELHVKVELAEG
ncbi:hypothetical protein IMZ31_19205 (plasmid) [Pontibacillus sp. ALD_SL1]|uniref:hypothetical protein n=1 Tax=Pontibacillus sp. ALD_SL1 TaxID=2777185 RepID=UPI001A95C15E|nr:hypothetical protein [Pontibacillus sp. ALD_SL1]QST02679.1 hypothetical protein IMZ31_19205 [Pontibacillus sp. ALD_SL1]